MYEFLEWLLTLHAGMLGNFFMLLLLSANFFQNQIFKKLFQE